MSISASLAFTNGVLGSPLFGVSYLFINSFLYYCRCLIVFHIDFCVTMLQRTCSSFLIHFVRRLIRVLTQHRISKDSICTLPHDPHRGFDKSFASKRTFWCTPTISRFNSYNRLVSLPLYDSRTKRKTDLSRGK